MKKSIITTTEIEEDGNIIEIELTQQFIEFYKKETCHSSITKKGITRFLNKLIELHQK